MATELLLSGPCPPDCSDPCVSTAPVGSTYLCTDTIDLLFRTQMSDPCDPVNDWESICTVCPEAAQPVTIENNGDGTATLTDANNDTITINIAANRVTVSEESGVDAGVAPVSPPAGPNVPGDLHAESYDDKTIIWQWNGVAWANGLEIPHCCPDPAVALADGDFADPDAPTVAEVNTYIAANGPFGPGTVFVLPGGGTAADPDWAWYYDGTTTTRIETLSDGTRVYHLDESGGDSPTTPTAPANPPTDLRANDTAIEFYDNNTLYWTYDGTNWTLDYTDPVCCPDPAEAMADGDFADPDNPTVAEVNTYIANNGPYQPGTIFVLPGDGTAADPDWAWYYDGTTTTRIETLSDGTRVYHLDESGGDSPVGPVAPANPPTGLHANDTAIEFYDNNTLYWTYDGTNWTLDYTDPVCCPDPAVTLVDGDFADPANPTVAEVNTYITNNGPFGPGTMFSLIGNGTATNPDWVWYYDGTTTTENESPTTALQPFRLIGADTSGGDASDPTNAQPNRQADMGVSDDVHHLGRMQLGGVVGDLLDVPTAPRLHVRGSTYHQSGTTAYVFNRTVGTVGETRYRVINRQSTPGPDDGYFRISPADDANASTKDGLTITDRHGNVGLWAGQLANKMGAEKIFIYTDDAALAPATVTPPAAPWDVVTAYTWGVRAAGVTEFYTMDSLGNVTQLSSHNVTIAGILGLTGMAFSTHSYNVFSGIGEGIDPLTARFIRYDIDTGNYEIWDGGVITGTGQDNNLITGDIHASLASIGFTGVRGQGFWDFVQQIYTTNIPGYVPQPPPPTIAQQFTILKPGVTPDDFTVISVIDATIQQNLYDQGIFTYLQLSLISGSEWTDAGGAPSDYNTMISEAQALIP